MKTILTAAAALLALAVPAMADTTVTTTPEMSLPEPESMASAVLPHSSMTETQPLALPEPETEAVAPFKRCGDRETVYLTN